MTNAQTEARAIALPATRPFVGRLIRIFTERPRDDTSAVVLIEYAQAALATALAAKDAELEEWRGKLAETIGKLKVATDRAERAEAQLAEANKARNYLKDAVTVGLSDSEISRRAKLFIAACEAQGWE